MLLIDKYKPSTKDDISFHEEIFKLLAMMSCDEAVPHVIFYGPDGCGKKTTVNLFLQMLFDETVNNVQQVGYKVTGSGNKVTIEHIKQSDYHIEINPKNTNFDRHLIHDVVKKYAKTKSLNIFQTNRPFKTILINHIDNMLYYAQTALRRTMERYNDKCRFIMWCKSLSKVIGPLQSRCICIRIPSPSNIELMGYVLKTSVSENIKLSRQQLFGILSSANGNIKKALWELEYLKFDYDLLNDYKKSIQKIVELYLKTDLSLLPSIRTIFFNLMITNFHKITILTDIINELCDCDKISDEIKRQIVSESTKVEYQLTKSRREIIQFDSFSIIIMKLIKESGQKN